nr:zinc knuckle CX2CX4HX4C [Tanacetum cinerariifolium]GFA77827.1 zinc knuckle CX2CX4HX4C [Tanacetum cinerariifolium]
EVFESKGDGGGRGVREKNRNRVLNNKAAKDGAVPFAIVASENNNGTQDENVGKCSYTVASNKGNVATNNNDPNNSSPSLSGPASYAKLVTREPRRNVSPTTRKSVNFCTLITPAGNETDVGVSLESIRAISERSSYARAMIELRADVELKDTIVVAMSKLVGEGFYMCTIRVEYEWKPPRCSSCKVFGHFFNECPKKIITDV